MSATPFPPDEPKLTAWGMPVPRYDPPAADPELGWTTAEDADDWSPPAAGDMPVTRFLMILAVAGYGTLRWVVCRTGLHRNRRYR